MIIAMGNETHFMIVSDSNIKKIFFCFFVVFFFLFVILTREKRKMVSFLVSTFDAQTQI